MLALSLFLLTALPIEPGYREGLQSHIEDDQNLKEQVSAIRDSLFVLLGFTLGMAVSRFDRRRELVVREANAIGTTYLRAQTLAQPYRDNLEQLLREYVDARIDFLAVGLDPTQFEQAVKRSHGLERVQIHDTRRQLRLREEGSCRW
jgi:hypothetical protein